MASGIFPLKEFDTWDAVPNKTYPILKTFMHKAYIRRRTSIQLHNTAGQQGYVQNPNNNMYNVFEEGDDKVTDDVTTITQTAAAATTGSTLGGATNAASNNATIPSEVSAAINQLSVNQTAMMNQMVAMQFSPPPPACHTGQGQIHVPPIQQLNIPVPQAYAEGSFNQDKVEEEDEVVEAGKGDVAGEEDARHLQTMCKHLDVVEEARDSKDVEALKGRS
jgi:hypothetical protein